MFPKYFCHKNNLAVVLNLTILSESLVLPSGFWHCDATFIADMNLFAAVLEKMYLHGMFLRISLLNFDPGTFSFRLLKERPAKIP